MFTVENQNSKTYLVYQLNEDDVIDDLTLGMMTNNKINGLLPIIYTQLDTNRFFKFDISSKIPASQIFSGTVNKQWINGIFSSIVNALIVSEEYMIDSNSFIQNLEYMFVDISKHTAEMICIPLQSKKPNVDFCIFFKQIIFSSKFDQNENNDYVANIISYLNSNVTFSAVDFKRILTVDTQSKNIKQAVQNNAPQPRTVAAVPVQNNYNTVQTQQNKSIAPQPVQQTPVQQMPLQQYNGTQAVPNAVNNGNNKKNKASQNKKNTKEVQNQPNGINIPKVANQQTNNQTSIPQNNVSNDKKMSIFYLLCHYNKDNVAAYKEQKNSVATNQSNNVPKAKMQKNNAPQSFNVPGAEVPNVGAVPQNFNIPGANTQLNSSAPQNYNVPQNFNIQNAEYNTPIQQSFNHTQESFGETTVLGGETDGETTVLGETNNTNNTAVPKRPFVIRTSNNERIEINKPVFRLGKERSYVDYFIGDNSYVSRGHANIIERNGSFYIVDNNSRNHTYVNGEIIGSGSEVELHNGDTFKLANEAFEFKLF